MYCSVYLTITNKAASIKAMVVHRIGDFGLALGIFGIFICFGSVDYATVYLRLRLNYLFS